MNTAESILKCPIGYLGDLATVQKIVWDARQFGDHCTVQENTAVLFVHVELKQNT